MTIVTPSSMTKLDSYYNTMTIIRIGMESVITIVINEIVPYQLNRNGVYKNLVLCTLEWKGTDKGEIDPILIP